MSEQSPAKLEARNLSAWQPERLCEGGAMEDLEMDPLFVALVLRLPRIDCEWGVEARAAWMRMFYAIADSLHPESVDGGPRKPDRSALAPTEELSSATVSPAQPEPQLERSFRVIEPDGRKKDAATIVADMIREVGKPGRVWYNKGSGRVRLCAEDYESEAGDVFVGVYGTKAKSSHIARDIDAIRKQANELGEV